MQIALNTSNSKITNNYGPSPTLAFDVEGKLVGKNGKDIKIEKTIENKTFQYSLRVKEEVIEKIGEDIKIDKTDIVSYSVEEKQQEGQNTDNINVEKALRELGLKYTSENVRMIEAMLKNGIKISMGNVDSYVKSKEHLKKVIEGIDIEKSIKLIEKGLNLEDDSLQKISEALESLEEDKLSFKKFLKIDKNLSYKQAEDISKDLYGQKMGKDVYDSIIALNKEKVPITRENIEKTLDAMKKIHNLKNLEDKVYIKFVDGDKDFNIDNLYKEKNQYTISRIQVSKDARLFENMTVKSQANIDSLKELLLELGIEDNGDNISILREFIVSDMDITEDRYNRLIQMKNTVTELLELVKENGISSIAVDSSHLKEDIFLLVEKLKDNNIIDRNLDKEENLNLSLENSQDDLKDKNLKSKDIENLKSKDIEDLNHSLKTLESIEDKDLVKLIKNGGDFNLKNIFEIKNTVSNNPDQSIEYKTVENTQKLLNIFNNLGDSLSNRTIARANEINKHISLESLDLANKELESLTRESREVVNREKTLFIQGEYIRIRNSLTTNTIKTSIIEGKIIEKMPIAELSPYIEKSLNKYREIEKMARDIKDIQGKDERLIPLIMKNDLEMTIRELREINNFLNGEKDLTSTIKDLVKDEENQQLKEHLESFQKNISDAIKKGKINGEDYSKLLDNLNSDNDSNEKDKHREKSDEYFKIKNKISKKDLVFQIPVEIGNGYKTLNVIIPNEEKQINKNNMNFFVSIETENIGRVDIDIDVRGRDIYIDLDEEKGLLNPVIHELENRFKSIGYSLNKIKDQGIL